MEFIGTETHDKPDGRLSPAAVSRKRLVDGDGPDDWLGGDPGAAETC